MPDPAAAYGHLVTYMLQGSFMHEDFCGHKGTINPGDLQWMTAGRGIVHSEMPAGDGDNVGLQLWINLKKKDKMVEPRYQELLNKDIPSVSKDGVHVTVIAGDSLGASSPVRTLTPTVYLDFKMDKGSHLSQPVTEGYCNDNCQHGALRLVNGGATYRGRLEICINSVWGSVCDDSFGTVDARVACRQLGYEVDGGQSISYYHNAYYGQSTGPIWLNRLLCTGSENNLLDCNKAVDIGSTFGCSHSEDVGIVCPANSCSTG
uniref:SRCR domain-containing protein n=1 Tax=Amphimedon queenslandica TaxID=400682 RepID=A0A1X7T403_AMPQE